MNRFMHVGFAFAGVPKVLDLEPVFNSIAWSDWIRYSPTNWIIHTERQQVEIYNAIVPYIDVGDNLLIAPLNHSELFGRLPEWVWKWLNDKNSQMVFGNYLNSLLSGPPKT